MRISLFLVWKVLKSRKFINFIHFHKPQNSGWANLEVEIFAWIYRNLSRRCRFSSWCTFECVSSLVIIGGIEHNNTKYCHRKNKKITFLILEQCPLTNKPFDGFWWSNLTISHCAEWKNWRSSQRTTRKQFSVSIHWVYDDERETNKNHRSLVWQIHAENCFEFYWFDLQ